MNRELQYPHLYWLYESNTFDWLCSLMCCQCCLHFQFLGYHSEFDCLEAVDEYCEILLTGQNQNPSESTNGRTTEKVNYIDYTLLRVLFGCGASKTIKLKWGSTISIVVIAADAKTTVAWICPRKNRNRIFTEMQTNEVPVLFFHLNCFAWVAATQFIPNDLMIIRAHWHLNRSFAIKSWFPTKVSSEKFSPEFTACPNSDKLILNSFHCRCKWQSHHMKRCQWCLVSCVYPFHFHEINFLIIYWKCSTHSALSLLWTKSCEQNGGEKLNYLFPISCYTANACSAKSTLEWW